MDIEYIKGDNLAFRDFIWEQKDKATLTSIDGHMRWVITKEDGTQYIARPQEAYLDATAKVNLDKVKDSIQYD